MRPRITVTKAAPLACHAAPIWMRCTRNVSSKYLCGNSFNSVTASQTFVADFRSPAESSALGSGM
eukprot:1276713-Pleurochrysis_carterae.AAC.1